MALDFSQAFGNREIEFLVDLGLAFLCGLFVGGEREYRGKPAGISTQILVITASMLFTFMSQLLDAGDPARIAAQVVSGIGFLGAGLILRSEEKNSVNNVTTAASIWYGAAIGMALGFNLHIIAVIAAVYAVVISSIPNIFKGKQDS
jgi:putative Mg2+ transporter-C (MgtC) family protein